MRIILEARAVSCTRALGANVDSAVRGVSLAIEQHSFTLMHGEEGCGRNLFLRLLGLLEHPDEGEIAWRGASIRRLSQGELAALRNQHFGFLFASPFLLPWFTPVENVAMPLLKVGHTDTGEAQRRTEELLELVGLGESLQCSIDDLSLEDQHRVSLARALANAPEVLILENVGRDLEPEVRVRFGSLLERVWRERGLTVIASGERDWALPHGARAIRMAAGSLSADSHPVPPEKGAHL